MNFKKVETKVLALGFNYGQTTKPIYQDLTMDTENAARHLDTKMFIVLAQKKMSQIKNSNTPNILLKRQLHIIVKKIHRKLMK